LKELQWKRKQLLQAQKAEVERKKAARAKRPAPPKLGLSKNASRAGSVAGGNKAPQAKVLDPKAPRAKPASPKAPQAKNPQKAPAKAAAKAPQVPKGSARK